MVVGFKTIQFFVNIIIFVLVTHYKFSENHHGGPQRGCSVVNFLISLVLTFGVNHQGLVVGENFAARMYAVPEIKNPSHLN